MKRLALFSLLAWVCACGGKDGGSARDPNTPDRVVETELLPADGILPVLEAPLGPEETTRLREGFDWQATTPLEERDPDGHPALYYRLIYISSSDEEQVLDLLEVPHNPLPFFPEERERWAGQSGVFTHFGDGEGHFVFSILPGKIWNEIRARALEGNPLFSAIVPREVPVAAAAHASGALRYDYLVGQGFNYRTTDHAEIPPASPDVGSATEPLIFELIALMAASHDVRDGVDDAISAVDREVRGRVRLWAGIRVHHTDGDFGAPTAEYSQAWRGEIGAPYRLANVPMVAQSAMGTIRARTGSDGIAVMEIAHGQMYTLCARGENHAAAISHSDRPVHLCTFQRSGDFSSGDALNFSATESVLHLLRVSDYHFNMLAQMTDARDYVEQVFGHRMSRGAAILIGPAADVFGAFNGGRAFAMCGGYNTFAVHSIAIIVGFFNSLIEPFGITSWRIAGHDIAFPSADATRATHSRLVPIHEYGHFLMCDLIAARGHDKITEAITDIMWTSFTTAQRPGVSNLVFTEAFADFFASRVAGGMNYINLPGEDPETNGRGSATSNAYYCHPSAPFCLEDNVGGREQRTPADANTAFGNEVAQFVTLLHDVFDGNVSGGRSAGIGAYYAFDPLSNVYRWQGVDRHQSDEEIALPAEALLEIFDEWARHHNTVTVRSMSNAIARVARSRGHSEAQVCALFALHEPDGDCRGLVDQGALDTTRAVPSLPIILSAEAVSHVTARVEWEDLSPFPSTETEWEARRGDVALTGRVPYVRRNGLTMPSLLPDTRYTISLSTINHERRGPAARTDVVTHAEPVTTLTLTPGPGQMGVSWAPVRASSYVVELESGGTRREVATVTEPTAVIGGLREDVPYTFRVYSRNQLGVRSAPSNPASGTVLMPNVVYVSSTRGNDTAANAGRADSPFQTFDAAMAHARERGIDVLRLEEGGYPSELAHVVEGRLTIEGGHRVTGSTWTPPAGAQRSILTLPVGQSVAGCSTTRFAGGATANAAIVVASGGELQLSGMELRRTEHTGTTCGTSVHLEGGRLVAQNSVVRGDFPVGSDGCAIGVQGRRVGSARPEVQLTGSVISGQAIGNTALRSRVAGLCLDGASQVQIDASRVFSAGGTHGALDVTTHVGLAARDVQHLLVRRSLLSTRGTPIVSSIAAATTGGFLAALEASGSGTIRVDNSVLFTHAGGNTNRAAEIGAASTSLTSVFFYHSVLNAGGNFALNLTVPTGLQTAALVLRGNFSGTEIGVVNSTLTVAAGRQEIGGFYAGLDRRTMTHDPLRFRLLGNVFSVGFPGALAACAEDEFGVIVTELELNRTTSHRCLVSTSTSTWATTSNRALSVPATEGTGCEPTCEAGFYCQAGSCRAREAERMLSFQTTGYPRDVDLNYVFGQTGVPLAGLPHTAEVALDFDGRMRTTTVREGAGAYLRR